VDVDFRDGQLYLRRSGVAFGLMLSASGPFRRSPRRTILAAPVGKGTRMVRTPHGFAHLEYDLKGGEPQ